MKFSYTLFLLINLVVPFSQAFAVEKKSLIDDLVKDIESAATCAGCAAILDILKGLAELGTSLFVDTLTEICIAVGIDDADVCTGAIASEGPIIAQDLKGMSIPSHTSDLFCITFFGLCPYPAVTPNTITFPTSKPSTNRPTPSGQTPLQIVHFSDIHVDLFYQTGASYNCTKPICCRSYTTADSPGNNQFPAGPNGNHKCDAPVSLEESMYAAIKSIAPNASMSLFTGDIVDHAVWLVNQTQNIKDINDAYSRMSGLTQVYGTAGNHEAAPANAFPPAAISSTNSAQWVYDTLSADWLNSIGTTAVSEAEKFGAYSVKYPNGNLRVISLNTNFYYVQNYWLYENAMEADPSGQLAWLVNELQAAETAGERVYIIGHMPMGLGDALRDGSNYFDQIVNRYSATIAALFFGHTHVDQFEIAYSDYTSQSFSNALEVSYVCPAMTPTEGHPAFRVYTVDPVTFGVLDSTTYIANMSSPGFQTTGPVWTKYYSAKETYGPLVTPPLTDPTAELTPAFWHNFKSQLGKEFENLEVPILSIKHPDHYAVLIGSMYSAQYFPSAGLAGFLVQFSLIIFHILFPAFLASALAQTQYTSTKAAAVAKARATALTESPTSNVVGKTFNRFVTIWCENTDYDMAAGDPNFQWIASQGITLNNYNALAHPSQPNYVAAVGGSSHGIDSDSFTRISSSSKTIVDLLEAAGVSWSEYQEDLPYSGFEASYVNQQTGANDYVRKHNGLVSYDSVTSNLDRLAKIKNFTMFDRDLANNQLPQWMFITPNMTNDGHDTSVTVAGEWARGFLTPLLSNSNFMQKTLILVTFDETETQTGINNVFSVLLGDAVPASSRGTTNATAYNHYSQMATVENNWSLGNLGLGDATGVPFF
ncbi:hypothetical protein G7Y89_g661 [Cudoniella acicularis]|uniref:Calcineurin-like phosphoesterase domain-containing protein n=1 Tax=Cudoniella acicularis TaxID=354080 RepID=A0A8H4RXR6_9HELO|nr:hypothetical protein G7Y89_g661 [Cudoniella acicularis]